MVDIKPTLVALDSDRADALIEVLKRESPDVLRFLYRRAESAEDAADLLSETLTTAWRKRSSIPSDPEAARMWLFGVARNHLANSLRGRLRQRNLADALRTALATAPKSTEGPERTVEMRRGLAALGAKDREILTLVAWEGFSFDEVGTLLRMPASTARSRYSRAKEKLRQVLGSS